VRITAWRIVEARYAAGAFGGEGSRRFGGRWNSEGTAVVYTAGSQALAVLEMLVHLVEDDFLSPYRLIPVTFDERIVSEIELRSLPRGWRRRSTPRAVRAIGDKWVASGTSAVLRVPSVLVPDESNYVLNVRHPDFAKVTIGRPQPYRFDPRLR
jgi:RES domain-containing protein